MLQLMLSLEPATVTDRRYPELFQTGETAYGKPLVDAQHPHNFIMGLGVHYAHPLAEDTTLRVLLCARRRSGARPASLSRTALPPLSCPKRPLSHHWQDSTHIADEVVTVGILHKKVAWKPADSTAPSPAKIAGSSNTEPINSWSTRLSVLPDEELGGASLGRKIGAPGAAGTRRRSSRHRVDPIHAAHAGLELVHQPDLGPEPQDSQLITT